MYVYFIYNIYIYNAQTPIHTETRKTCIYVSIYISIYLCLLPQDVHIYICFLLQAITTVLAMNTHPSPSVQPWSKLEKPCQPRGILTQWCRQSGLSIAHSLCTGEFSQERAGGRERKRKRWVCQRLEASELNEAGVLRAAARPQGRRRPPSGPQLKCAK